MPDKPFDQADFEPADDPKPFNVYSHVAGMARSVLLGQQREPVLAQARAFLTYDDPTSAMATIADFSDAFLRKYGAS